jgi:hypothetical protein
MLKPSSSFAQTGLLLRALDTRLSLEPSARRISRRAPTVALKLRAAKLRSGELEEFSHESVHRRKDRTSYDIDLRLVFSRIDVWT